MMFCMTHPQMIAIHKLLLGPEVRHDHHVLLGRKPGFPGQIWHSHAHHEGAPDSHLSREGHGHPSHDGPDQIVYTQPNHCDLGMVRTPDLT